MTEGLAERPAGKLAEDENNAPNPQGVEEQVVQAEGSPEQQVQQSEQAGQQPGEPGDEPEQPATIEEYRAMLAAKEAECQDLFQRLQRLQADFENYRRRVRREQEELVMYANEDLMKDLLPVLDNLERAVAAPAGGDVNAYLEGVSMICRQMKDSLSRRGLAEIQSVGHPFDPVQHHAVMQVEVEGVEENTVVEDLQKGYRLRDRVIRPSLVKVAR